jgi:hypothetical protein
MNLIEIRIDTMGEAFDDRLSEEIQAILNAPQIINRLCSEEGPSIQLFDSNGDVCGYATAKEEKL